jgi:hypothetical protein
LRIHREKPRIVLLIARGEAVRNFLYSDTLPALDENARVTLLSVIHDEPFCARFSPYVNEIIPLREYPEPHALGWLQHVIWHAHYRWQWSKKAQNKWEILDYQANTPAAKVRFRVWKALMRSLAFRPMLEALTALYDWAGWIKKPTDEFERLFRALKPDLVFNTAHIHAPAADLPMRVAKHMGIPTAAFIFSWDNLTSRSRITVPYDYYLVWHKYMHDELLSIYPVINPKHVFITGTPQFDFHFKPKFWMSREELCACLGIDPRRPFVLYTTGKDNDFPEEHRHVEAVIQILCKLDLHHRPQLVVRTYIKGTSPEMMALAARNIPGVVFPPILWEKDWFMPKYEDLAIYTSLLRHAGLVINAASTVSLEAMMHDKPVVNLGFDPPGSRLPHPLRWIRHIEYEHYRPVAQSGGVAVAYSLEDLRAMIFQGLTAPEADSQKRLAFVGQMFGSTLDGKSGCRVAETLMALINPN